MKYFARHTLLAMMMLSLSISSSVCAPATVMPDMNESGDDEFAKMFDFDSEEFQNLIRQMETQMKSIEENLPPEKKEALEAMKKRTQELSEKLDAVDQDVNRYTSEKADLKTQVKELRARNAELQEDKKKLIGAIDVLSDDATGERAEKQGELEELDEQLADNEKELELKREEKRGIKAQLKQSEEEFASTQQELEQEQAKGEDIFDGVNMDFDDSMLGSDDYAEYSDEEDAEKEDDTDSISSEDDFSDNDQGDMPEDQFEEGQ